MASTSRSGKDVWSAIGLASYQRSFGLQFVREAELASSASYDSRARVIVSPDRYGMRKDLAGKKVAIVGNGDVRNCGSLIDSCDEVIRINTMRNWRRNALDDGLRVTIWVGHPWLMVRRDNQGTLTANPLFAELGRNQTGIWAASPFHISVDAYRWLQAQDLLDRILVAPPPAGIYEIACGLFDAEDIRKLFSIAPQIQNIVGFPYFDLLLTGTRLVLMLELCGVTNICLFGANLFNFSGEGVWFGHDLELDYEVLMRAKQRILAHGGKFYWHEEQQVRMQRERLVSQ